MIELWIFEGMFKKLVALIFLLSFLCACLPLRADEEDVIRKYLDSCTKYLNKGRVDLVVQFNLKADALAQAKENSSYKVNYKIQNNYVWAFSEINQQELKKYHLKKQIDLIKLERELGNESYNLYLISLGNLAGLYNSINELDSAKKYFELAIEVAKEYGKYTYISGTLNNMGLFMIKYKNWEEAKPYFDEALQLLRVHSNSDSILYSSIRDNVADYYLHKGDSIRGMKIVEENLQFLNPNKKTVRKLMRWGNKLLPYYIDNNKYDKADKLVKRLEQILVLGKGKWKFENRASLIKSKLTIERNRGNKEQLNELLKEQSLFLEEYLTFLKINNKGVNQLLAEYQAYYVNQEIKAAEKEVQEAEARGRRNLLLLLLSLLVSILILLLIRTNYKRRIRLESGLRLLKAKELQISQLEKEKITVELESKSKDFSQLLMQSALQEDWSKYLVEKLQTIRKTADEQKEAEIKMLILELKQKGGMYEKLHELQKGMEEANTHFFKLLDSKFPELTKAEKETCGLIRMNMQSKEIAMIRNISPSSVRKLRQRIRAKLGLELKQDLYAFIHSL